VHHRLEEPACIALQHTVAMRSSRSGSVSTAGTISKRVEYSMSESSRDSSLFYSSEVPHVPDREAPTDLDRRDSF
jgi:hypothetical protein